MILPRVCNFDNGKLTEWSDHVPVKLSLSCNVSCTDNIPEREYKYKWSNERRHDFRNGLIGKLTDFNSLNTNVTVENGDSVNDMITQFTSFIQQVADPMFCKECTATDDKIRFKDKSVYNNKDWFDSDCVNARNEYSQALRVFERDKCNTSWEYFCSCKSKYKKICKRKRYKYEKKKIDEIERLRFSKPKQFWKYFKKDKSRVSTDVKVVEFSEYFSQLGNKNLNHVNQDAESFCDNNNVNDNPSGVYE